MKFSQKVIFRVVMVLAIGVFLMANLSMIRLVSFRGLILDFTGERFFALSDATITAVSALQSETWIYILSEEGMFPPVLSEIIRRYGFLSPFINIRYVDPHIDLVFLDHYRRQGFPLTEFDLLVAGDRGIRHIPITDIIRRDTRGRPTHLFLEEKLTNALVYANTGRSFSASFTVGHGERPAALRELLSGTGFSVNNLVFLTGEIPEADVIIIADPERDFRPEEIAALSSYLESGGRLMVFIGPGAARLPELEGLLSSWGFYLMPGVILETMAHVFGNPAGLIPMYGMHQINMDFAMRQYYLVMPGTRAIEIPEDTGEAIITRLLLSTSNSFIRTGMDFSSARGPDDPGGPFVLAAVAEKSDGVIMLFGSGGVFNADILATPAFANREYFVRAALWLAGGRADDTISIPPRTLMPQTVHAGFVLILTMLLVFVILLPIGVLVTGSVMLYRRRRR